jgi:hypothetical protein
MEFQYYLEMSSSKPNYFARWKVEKKLQWRNKIDSFAINTQKIESHELPINAERKDKELLWYYNGLYPQRKKMSFVHELSLVSSEIVSKDLGKDKASTQKCSEELISKLGENYEVSLLQVDEEK